MEWMNRGGEPQQAANTPAQPAGTKTRRGRGGSNNLRIMSVALLFAVTIVLVGVVGLLTLGGGNKSEGGFVEKDKLQAVFLAGGQVYFGNISELNDEYVEMKNIYYLRVNQTVQPEQEGNEQPAAQNDISLVKLGCELHGPTDQMLINRSQVIFWENLKTDGQVANAVKDYVAANPNGQDCNAQQDQPTNPAGSTQPTENE